MSQELLRFDGVTAGYGRRVILRDVNLSLHTGDYLAIVGSNGSGKTTLLRTLLGIMRPLSGSITFPRRPHFGYVPQLQTVDEIFPLSALEVVLMGRYGRVGVARRAGKIDREAALSALREVSIEALANRLYRELSGGQKQRTLIARAVCSEPDVLVLDEHTNDLDIAAEKDVMALIDRLHAQHQFAVVMVSHSINIVANHARTIGILKDGACRLAPASDVLNEAFLRELYGVPLRVIEIEGQRVVL